MQGKIVHLLRRSHSRQHPCHSQHHHPHSGPSHHLMRPTPCTCEFIAPLATPLTDSAHPCNPVRWEWTLGSDSDRGEGEGADGTLHGAERARTCVIIVE